MKSSGVKAKAMRLEEFCSDSRHAAALKIYLSSDRTVRLSVCVSVTLPCKLFLRDILQSFSLRPAVAFLELSLASPSVRLQESSRCQLDTGQTVFDLKVLKEMSLDVSDSDCLQQADIIHRLKREKKSYQTTLGGPLEAIE
ncbi:hypothetical protein DPX16_1866 [Anabarilius grahami]|uniref:Uncharacterized protein n=1 Tax=Anabarilius grahami TaxID=495550 RepID=A0A3N0YRV1_ANAGA|nr:hypothetical protein DPX16_1866 [Anabarilius grahami]